MTPPIPPDFPQYDKHPPPNPLENFVQEGRVLKMKQLIQISLKNSFEESQCC